YTVIGRARTTADGRYSFVIPAGEVTTNRNWYATARGLRSRVLPEHARPVVSLASTATFAVAGDVETFSGQLQPGLAGQPISLQRQSGRRWLTVTRARVGRTATFSVNHKFTTGRTEQWRALAPASPKILASASPTLRI